MNIHLSSGEMSRTKLIQDRNMDQAITIILNVLSHNVIMLCDMKVVDYGNLHQALNSVSRFSKNILRIKFYNPIIGGEFVAEQ